MSKITIRGMGRLREDLLKVVNESVNNEDMLNEMGEQAVKYIRGKTQSGAGEYKQPDVSNSWAEQRAALASSNQTSPLYIGSVKAEKKGKTGFIKGYYAGKFSKNAKSKSTMTFTGELMRSFVYACTRNQITLYFTGIHKAYKNSKGAVVSPAKPNSEIYRELKAKGRYVLFLDNSLKRIMKITAIRHIRRRISRYKRST